MRAILLTSTFRRHRFAANHLAERCDLRGVWQEVKTFVPERHAEDARTAEVIRRHFAARDESEARYFAADDELRLSPDALAREVGPGGCSDPGEVARMAALEPDVVLVFGTGILRQPVLRAFDGRLLNIHLGLSPYYRGAGTNFWPLVNREPEYVGATIHVLDAGIDTGPILAHVRPALLPDDGPHDVGNKTIVAAVDGLYRAAEAHAAGRARAVPQGGGGRLYQRRDFGAAAVEQMLGNFATVMLPEYLEDRARRDAALRLVSLDSAA